MINLFFSTSDFFPKVVSKYTFKTYKSTFFSKKKKKALKKVFLSKKEKSKHTFSRLK